MNKKRISMVLVLIIFASIFINAGCQVEDDTDRTDDIINDQDNIDNGKINSEEELADLKIEVVEGEHYRTIDIPIEDFELEDLKGNRIKLSDYKGKIVFLNFWATWCPPCEIEMPYMQEIYDKYEDVVILAVNSTSTELKGGTNSKKARRQVEKFIDKEGYTFPVLLDAKDEVTLMYDSIFPLIGIPTTFIIDKNGSIRYVTGMFVNKAHMEQFIKLAHK